MKVFGMLVVSIRVVNSKFHYYQGHRGIVKHTGITKSRIVKHEAHRYR